MMDQRTCETSICHPSMSLRKEKKRKEKKRKEKKRKEKKRKDYAFRRQFNEKPNIIQGCPGVKRY